MNTFSNVPPGFRFHPTDEELVDYYLRKKINCRRIDLDVIRDVDLYKIEPWDLQELCRIGTEEQNEWYFFSHKDKKYPTGTRTNRATAAGFWKATGRDKAIYSKHDLIGMRKTLVFYKGRAPNGQKSDWIMHEYRLETDENGTPQEEGWVVCRVFKKRITSVRKMSEHESPISWYEDQVSFMPELDSPKQTCHSNNVMTYQHHPYSCKKEIDHLQYNQIPHEQLLIHLPLLESPKLLQSTVPTSMLLPYGTTQEEHIQQVVHHDHHNFHSMYGNIHIDHNEQAVDDQVTDWRVLDKFVATQLSQEDNVSKLQAHHDYSNAAAANVFHPSTDHNTSMLVRHLNKQELAPQNASTSAASTCQIDLWKL